jgi:hypothetical protein
VLDASAVGRRVVVRSVVAGETAPSGRPLLTDVIGVLETWADGRLAVRRSTGELVEIALADVVAGKVVPPAPARRRPRRA